MKEKGRFEQRLFLRTKEQWFPNFIEITYTGIGKTHEGFVLFPKIFLPLLTLLGKIGAAKMGIAERKERQKKEVRDSILQSAWQLVNEEGWQNLSIRKIADAIEYSVPVVYDHFENKEAILTVFNRRGFQLLGDELKTAKVGQADAKQQLNAIAFAYWDFAFQHKEYYQLMFGLGMPGCQELANVPELVAFIEVIGSTIGQVVAEGTNKTADVQLKVRSFWSTIHGLVSINLMAPPSMHEGVSKDQMNKLILNDFLNGFLKGLTE